MNTDPIIVEADSCFQPCPPGARGLPESILWRGYADVTMGPELMQDAIETGKGDVAVLYTGTFGRPTAFKEIIRFETTEEAEAYKVAVTAIFELAKTAWTASRGSADPWSAQFWGAFMAANDNFRARRMRPWDLMSVYGFIECKLAGVEEGDTDIFMFVVPSGN